MSLSRTRLIAGRFLKLQSKDGTQDGVPRGHPVHASESPGPLLMSRRRTQKSAVNARSCATPFHKLLSTAHKRTNNNHLAVGAACNQVRHHGHVRPLERAARNNSPPSRAMSLGNDSGDAVKPRPAISIRERLASPHFVLRCRYAAHDSCEWVQHFAASWYLAEHHNRSGSRGDSHRASPQ